LKKLIYISFLSLLLSTWGIAQVNLVPNPGFEDTLGCVSAINQFQGYVAKWMGMTPSYFNDSCPSVQTGIPDNIWGYQYPHSGRAYAGVHTFSMATFVSDMNKRDYIYVPLTDSLQGGKLYTVSFFVNLANNCEYACKNIGAWFSPVAPNLNGNLLRVTPQVDNFYPPLTDTLGWTQLYFTLLAKGGERFMTIGNFHSDSLSSSTYLHPAVNNTYDWRNSFYYIDDVSVTLDTLDHVGIRNIPEPAATLTVFPNPNSGQMTLDLLHNVGQGY
jgi:OOP family OmpA-OmpF porin